MRQIGAIVGLPTPVLMHFFFFTLSLPSPTPHSATLRSKLQSNLRSSAIKTDPLTGAGGGGAMGLQALSG